MRYIFSDLKEWIIRATRVISNLIFFWLLAIILNFFILHKDVFTLLWIALFIALVLEMVDFFARTQVRIPASKREELEQKLKELGYDRRQEGLYARTGEWGWNPKLLWVDEDGAELVVRMERHRDAREVEGRAVDS